MKFLREILSSPPSTPEIENIEDTESELDSDDFNINPEDNQDLDQIASKATEDPNKQGLIRKVKGAHLVYKRETEDGTFEEMWCYNVKDSLQNELSIRRSILSGTDIPSHRTSSEDGSQTYSIWTSGNIEILCIFNLPN